MPEPTHSSGPRKDVVDADPESDSEPFGGAIRELRILPLIDFLPGPNPALATEAGVSYLVQADETNILFDLGFNRKNESPSPLLRNMEVLGIDPSSVDMVVISHPHADHIGGRQRQGWRRTIPDEIAHVLEGLPVFSTRPLPLRGMPCTVVTGPGALHPGIMTTGPMRTRLLLRSVLEQVLLVHVAEKGVVAIVGCGHPGLEKILEKIKDVTDLPLYGILGGLHYPVTDDRCKVGPIPMQRLLGTPHPLTAPPDKAMVEKGIERLRSAGVEFVALSPHDSCDWSIAAFAEAFGDCYHHIRVGEEIAV